jgi:hypothetical protein
MTMKQNLDQKILELVESKVEQHGVESVMEKAHIALHEAKRRKQELLKRNFPLGNTDEHIEVCINVIKYLKNNFAVK